MKGGGSGCRRQQRIQHILAYKRKGKGRSWVLLHGDTLEVHSPHLGGLLFFSGAQTQLSIGGGEEASFGALFREANSPPSFVLRRWSTRKHWEVAMETGANWIGTQHPLAEKFPPRLRQECIFPGMCASPTAQPGSCVTPATPHKATPTRAGAENPQPKAMVSSATSAQLQGYIQARWVKRYERQDRPIQTPESHP